MTARDYRAQARAALAGNWLMAYLVALVAAFLGGGSSSSISIDLSDYQIPDFLMPLVTAMLAVSSVLAIVHFIIGGTIKLGYCRYLLDQHDGIPADIRALFSQFSIFSKGFLLSFLTGLFTALWTLLFIIPGVIASYSYAMAPFIQVENPDYSAMDCIRASKDMMKGYRMKLFLLDLSFLGWALLSLLTLGICAPFVTAYSNAARAAFYRDVEIGDEPDHFTTTEPI